MNSHSLARGLAFFSIGLGAAELLAPRTVARAIGIDEDNATWLRMFGVREIGAGLGIMEGNRAAFVWSRVVGDAIDLGCLGAALRSRRSSRNRVLGAIATVAGVTLLDVISGVLLTRSSAEPHATRRQDERATEEYSLRHRRESNQGSAGEQRQTERREENAIRQFEPGD